MMMAQILVNIYTHIAIITTMVHTSFLCLINHLNDLILVNINTHTIILTQIINYHYFHYYSINFHFIFIKFQFHFCH